MVVWFECAPCLPKGGEPCLLSWVTLVSCQKETFSLVTASILYHLSLFVILIWHGLMNVLRPLVYYHNYMSVLLHQKMMALICPVKPSLLSQHSWLYIMKGKHSTLYFMLIRISLSWIGFCPVYILQSVDTRFVLIISYMMKRVSRRDCNMLSKKPQPHTEAEKMCRRRGWTCRALCCK